METRKEIPESEFIIFSFALSLLSKLYDPDQYAIAKNNLLKVLQNADKEASIEVLKKHIDDFIAKFTRKISPDYGKEGFDLSVISSVLKTSKDQVSYLQGELNVKENNARQIINIVCKVINHFHLKEIAITFKQHFPDQIHQVFVEKFINPEYMLDNSPRNRYRSLLTVMHDNEDFNQPSVINSYRNNYTRETGFRLIPKDKMNPRLPWYEINNRTPSEIRYNIDISEKLTDDTEIVGTEILLDLSNDEHASKTPGKMLLSSFPLLKAKHDGETVHDLIEKLNVGSVLTVEERIVALRTIDGEVKALPTDWEESWMQSGKQHNPNVTHALAQCEDLHALPARHNFLLAQYLFHQKYKCLTPNNDINCHEAIRQLMNKRFEKSDENERIKKNDGFGNKLFEQAISVFTHEDESKYVKYFDQVMQTLQWENKQVLASKNDESVLVHCKAGKSRSATALISMYVIFVDVILRWYQPDFIQNEHDKAFYGAILHAIFKPSHDVIHDVHHIKNIFSMYYRHIKLLQGQDETIAQYIHYKSMQLQNENNILKNNNVVYSYEKHEIHLSLLGMKGPK